MQITGKRKLVLIIAAILVVVVVLIIVFSSSNKTPVPASVTPSPKTSTGSKTPYGQLPNGQTGKFSPVPTVSLPPAKTNITSIGSGIVRYTEPANPAPGAGPLDWTRKDRIIADFSNSPLANKTLCQMTDLQNSWNSPLEKFVCDSFNLITDKVILPFYQLDCMLAASNLQTYYSKNIKWEFKDLECKIIDR